MRNGFKLAKRLIITMPIVLFCSVDIFARKTSAQTWKTYGLKSAPLFLSRKEKTRYEVDISSIFSRNGTTYLNTRVFSPITNQFTNNFEVEIDCQDGIIHEILYLKDGEKQEDIRFRQADSKWFTIWSVERGGRDPKMLVSFGDSYFSDIDKSYESLFNIACKGQ